MDFQQRPIDSNDVTDRLESLSHARLGSLVMIMAARILKWRTAMAWLLLFVASSIFPNAARAADTFDFQPVPDFFKLPDSWTVGGCSAVSTNSKGEIYLFQRGPHPI